MAVVGFLRFSLLCFDFLAWPAFALAYPLWASIRAIETSSKYHMRKLVTYWTIFSFISLFEIFFARFLEWVPFWAYIKLVIICWLVVPQFDGACYVYQCLLHPCLSVNLRDVINWFCVLVEKQSIEEIFLASADKYIKENGPEALEKLIANKANCKEHILADADALEGEKRAESPENITAEEQLVELPKLDLVHSEKKEIAAAEAKQLALPAESEERRSVEIHALKKVQREWTCAMCQVTTTSEATLNSHLLGKKHRSKCEELNTCTQTAKNMQSPPVKQMSKPEELKTSTQSEKSSNSWARKTNDSNQANGNLQNFPPGGGSRQNTTEKPKSNHINVASCQQMQVKAMNNNAAVVNQQSKFWCSICNVRCTSEKDLASHLKGRLHALDAAVVNQQSKFWCTICNVRCTSETDLAAHLNGRKHVEMQSNFCCSICDVRCTTAVDMAAHLRGRKHVLEIQSKTISG